MNPKIDALIVRVGTALKGKPGLGTFWINFGVDDGSAYINSDNSIHPMAGDALHDEADCTITFEDGIAGLEKLEAASPFTQAWMLADGEVTVEGDRSLAEKLVGILKNA